MGATASAQFFTGRSRPGGRSYNDDGLGNAVGATALAQFFTGKSRPGGRSHNDDGLRNAVGATASSRFLFARAAGDFRLRTLGDNAQEILVCVSPHDERMRVTSRT